MEKTVHIAVVPGPWYSHLVSILEFSKLLVQLHPDFHVTCIIPTLGSPSTASNSFLQTLPSNINYTFLPPVNPNHLPQDSTLESKIQLTVSLSLPSLHQALNSLTVRTPPVALVVDSLSAEALDLAKEFNMLSYVYFPAAATTLCYYFHLLKVDKETSREYRDLPEAIQAPGCVPIHGKDLIDQAQDRSSQAYKFLLQRLNKFFSPNGILINSFLEIEKGPIQALAEGSGNPAVYPVGPIIQTRTESDYHSNGKKCLTWLDKQQTCSVLYVSFGSGGRLSQEQIVELSLGLELSNHKFLWVFRAPSSSASDAYLSAQDDIDASKFLPSGFLERTKEQGMVIPSWAPQVQILSHRSAGGFLSHCGWNSVLESVMHGVPLIAWPLFAEQRMNAVLLSESLKVGLRPKVQKNGIVERVQISELIKCLMEGEEGDKLRKRINELKEGTNSALKEDGSSAKTISLLAHKLRNLA
ncbi:unnamed protein product [Lathyrus sativus]|nr:unnamed protein product [Lathyrus sativus]